MALIGSTIGHYRIVEKLGEGGMGEVYRAEDTTLKRQVALKVLPPDLGSSRERLDRFQREAETLAALDHPNIVTLYSVEEVAGQHFLTMQLVEGKSLHELIPEGGMSVSRALRIAISLTEALRAAHDKGVIHRDLKPANVIIDTEGRARVLDFGLAKLRPTEPEEGASLLPTETMTREGVIVGTIPYMSPEQIQGEAVDHRTDFFSFGILLHEMLCGQRPFQASNTAALMSNIMRDPPIPAGQVRPDLPRKLELIIERCLEKDPLLRYRAADEIWLDLRDVQNRIGGTDSHQIEAAVERVLAKAPTGQAPGTSPESSPPIDSVGTTTSPPRKWLWWLGALGMIWGLVFASYYVFFGRSGTNEAGAPLGGALHHKQLTSQPGVEQIPSLSPDGEWVVYSGEGPEHQDIFLQSVSGQTPFNLTEGSGADNQQPSFSPDGQSIAFRSSREGGGLFVMGRTGEAVRRVTREGFNPSWSPDGTRLVFSSESVGLNPLNWDGRAGIWLAEVETGRIQEIQKSDGVQPSWSPAGDRIAFVSRLGDPTQMDISTIPTDGGEPVNITNDAATDWSPVWAPDGRHIYFASDRSGSMNLWRVAVDPRSGEARGEPEPLTTPATYLAHPTVSADGNLVVYSSVLMTQNIQSLELDIVSAVPPKQADWVTSGSMLWSSVDVSPDGEWLVFYSRTRPEGVLYVCRSDGTALRQLTGDDALARVPRWSPDGQWVAFFSTRSGSIQVWKVRRDGSELQQLTDLEDNASLLAWAPDGSQIAAVSGLGPEAVVVLVDPDRTSAEQTPEYLPPVDDGGPPMVVTSWSPDGTMLAGQAGYPGMGVIVYSLATRSYRRLSDFGEWPVWLPDSQRLLFVSGGSDYFVVDSASGETRKVFSEARDVIGPPRTTADGSRAFFSRRVTEADLWVLTTSEQR
jgi:Tol biopolymer transport system component